MICFCEIKFFAFRCDLNIYIYKKHDFDHMKFRCYFRTPLAVTSYRKQRDTLTLTNLGSRGTKFRPPAACRFSYVYISKRVRRKLNLVPPVPSFLLRSTVKSETLHPYVIDILFSRTTTMSVCQ